MIFQVLFILQLKAVGESVENPLLYENNINALFMFCRNYSKNQELNFIFSSSCTVYGQAETMPITENAPFNCNVSLWKYKQIGKKITDTAKVLISTLFYCVILIQLGLIHH
jgi:UDP-glucose 4-epimerase